ncbi:MAG TPA: Fic family protein [Ktedonobacterales bacterium]
MNSSLPPDPYEYSQYPGVLVNKLNIHNAAQLQEAETVLTAIRISELEAQPLLGRFDLAHLQAIHRSIFQDIYPWAGELRMIDIVKDRSYFASHRYLESSAHALFMRLKQEKHLHGLPRERFTERAAYYLGELNALHPFREGNGRTQRMFLLFLARASGYDLLWHQVTPEHMLRASEASLLQGNNQEFTQMFLDITIPLPLS